MVTKLLIVDDEIKIIKILSKILAEEGYQLFTADTGEEGVICARKEKPDLAVPIEDRRGRFPDSGLFAAKNVAKKAK